MIWVRTAGLMSPLTDYHAPRAALTIPGPVSRRNSAQWHSIDICREATPFFRVADVFLAASSKIPLTFRP